jgi:hypothetical protein
MCYGMQIVWYLLIFNCCLRKPGLMSLKLPILSYIGACQQLCFFNPGPIEDLPWQVAMHEGKLVPVDLQDDFRPITFPQPEVLQTASLDITGLPYAWEVFLHASDSQVADNVRDWLVGVYTSLVPELQQQQASVRQAMLECAPCSFTYTVR